MYIYESVLVAFCSYIFKQKLSQDCMCIVRPSSM